ncbi:MAG: hypothetical protein AAGJ50_00380, partial [Pseudomonadota bacterium]
PDVAMSIFEQACTANIWEACESAAMLLGSPTNGIPEDRERALTYYQRGCQMGYQRHCLAARDYDLRPWQEQRAELIERYRPKAD